MNYHISYFTKEIPTDKKIFNKNKYSFFQNFANHLIFIINITINVLPVIFLLLDNHFLMEDSTESKDDRKQTYYFLISDLAKGSSELL